MTETEADMKGVKLSRDERKELRKEDLRRADYTRLMEIRKKTQATIEYLHATHERQLANGIPVTSESLGKNCSTHWLTVQCIDEILDDAITNDR